MRTVLVILLLALLGACAIGHLERTRPQDLPWTPLALDQPVGMFTARKIAGLADNPAQCRAILADAPGFTPVPDRAETPDCGWTNAFRLSPPALAAPATTVTCPVAISYAIWRRQYVEPAAMRAFGTGVRTATHFGSYSCRRLYGRGEGAFSQHARANALDISGFTLADGRRITVVRDWTGDDRARARFLREAQQGACRLFGTTLSPDYNAAHADHLHLDMGGWGGFGVCS